MNTIDRQEYESIRRRLYTLSVDITSMLMKLPPTHITIRQCILDGCNKIFDVTSRLYNITQVETYKEDTEEP